MFLKCKMNDKIMGFIFKIENHLIMLKSRELSITTSMPVTSFFYNIYITNFFILLI